LPKHLIALFGNVFAEGCPLRVRTEKEKIIVTHLQTAAKYCTHSSFALMAISYLGSLLDQDFGVHDFVGCLYNTQLYVGFIAIERFGLLVTPPRIYLWYYFSLSWILFQICFFGDAAYWMVLNSELALLRVLSGMLTLDSRKSLPFNCAISLAICWKNIRGDCLTKHVCGFVLQEFNTLTGITIALYFAEKWVEGRIRATFAVSSSLQAVQKLLDVSFDAEIHLGADLQIKAPSQRAVHLLAPPSDTGDISSIANIDFTRFVTEPHRQRFRGIVLRDAHENDPNAILGPPRAMHLELQDSSGYTFGVDIFHVQVFPFGDEQPSHLLCIRESEPAKRVIPCPHSTASMDLSFNKDTANQSLKSLESSLPWFDHRGLTPPENCPSKAQYVAAPSLSDFSQSEANAGVLPAMVSITPDAAIPKITIKVAEAWVDDNASRRVECLTKPHCVPSAAKCSSINSSVPVAEAPKPTRLFTDDGSAPVYLSSGTMPRPVPTDAKSCSSESNYSTFITLENTFLTVARRKHNFRGQAHSEPPNIGDRTIDLFEHTKSSQCNDEAKIMSEGDNTLLSSASDWESHGTDIIVDTCMPNAMGQCGFSNITTLLALRARRIPSLGSLLHAEGRCASCDFNKHSRLQCRYGFACDRCHLPHKGISRKALRKRNSSNIREARTKRLLFESAIRLRLESSRPPVSSSVLFIRDIQITFFTVEKIPLAVSAN
jgi:hypothetical protein